MFSREFDFVSWAQDLSKKRAERIEAISQGLDWGNASFLRTPESVQQTINATIDDQLCRLVNYLHIPYPDVGLLQNWNEVPPEGQRPMGDADADSVVTKTNPDGLIRISPRYIKSVVSYQLGMQMPVMSLEALVGHEAFHLWQWKYAKDKLQKDINLSLVEGIVPWAYTDSEVQAREFENSWMENWMNFPVTDIK